MVLHVFKMAELEQIGIAGPDYLRETLTNCSDPLKAIEEFQEQNSILLPSLKPSLHFLDLHLISRVDFNTSGTSLLKSGLPPVLWKQQKTVIL